MSIFLMGCYDEANNVWCTVTKVHGGHDDKTLEKLQVITKQYLFRLFLKMFAILYYYWSNRQIINDSSVLYVLA